jgi:hypothetical protein
MKNRSCLVALACTLILFVGVSFPQVHAKPQSALPSDVVKFGEMITPT